MTLVVAGPFCQMFHSGTISWAVVNSAGRSASAADAVTILMICAMQSTGPLGLGMRSSLEMKM